LNEVGQTPKKIYERVTYTQVNKKK